jgi:hypothetical protein
MARKAATVDAEGELTEEGARPDRWFQVSRRIKRVLDESAEWFGPDNPLTLDLMVLYGQALVDGSRPLDAFAVLADAEARAARSLGGDHPLALRIRQCTGLATMGLADWPAAATIFEDLLRRQDSVLGRQHPDSRLTRTRLAECRARSTGRPAPARVLTRMPSALLRVVNRVDDAARRRWA